MSEANVEIMRHAYDAYSRGDLDGAVAAFAPDCEYVASGAVPGSSSVYQGPEGYKRLLASFNEEFDGVQADLHELIDADDQVVVSATLRGRGKQSGAMTGWDIWQVWTLREGRVIYGQGFLSREQALEAAGLSP